MTDHELPLIEEISEIYEKPKLEPEELLVKLGHSAHIFEAANNRIKTLFQDIKREEARTRVFILAKDFERLNNVDLKEHLKTIFKNEKYKPTLDDMANFIYLETQQLAEVFEEAQVVAKQAEKEAEMWARQLSWYQSELKYEGAELMNLNRQPG